MLRFAVIIGSTRPNRVGKGVADWVYSIAKNRDDIEVELVDIADFNLPLLDEPTPPSMGRYTKDHTKKWSEKISSFDAFIFVTPEYNHSVSGALKNALDFLYKEWNNKVAGFVGYGSAKGFRAIEALRLIMAELQIADVRMAVGLSLSEDFENYSILKANENHEELLNKMIDQMVPWAEAMNEVRSRGQYKRPEKATTESLTH